MKKVGRLLFLMIFVLNAPLPLFAELKGSSRVVDMQCEAGYTGKEIIGPSGTPVKPIPEGGECDRDYESCKDIEGAVSFFKKSPYVAASAASVAAASNEGSYILSTCQKGKCVAKLACEGFELKRTEIPPQPPPPVQPPVKDDIPEIPTDSTAPDLAEVLPPDDEVPPQPPPEEIPPVPPTEAPVEDVTPSPRPPQVNPGTASNLRPPRPPSTFGGGDTPWDISPYPFQESTFGGGGWSSGGSNSANGFYNIFSNIISSLFGAFGGGGGGGGGGGSGGGGWGSGGQSSNVSRPPSPFQVADAGDANQAAQDLLEKIKKAQNEIRAKKGLDPIPPLPTPPLEDRIGIPSNPPREPITGGSPRIPLEDVFRQERLDNTPSPRSDMQSGIQVTNNETGATDGPPSWWPPGREWVPPEPPPSAEELAKQKLRDALKAHSDAREAWNKVPWYRKIFGYADAERDRVNQATDNLDKAIREYGDTYAPDKPQYAEWESFDDLAEGEWRHRVARCLLGEGVCAGEASDARRVETPPPAEPLAPGGVVPGLADKAKELEPFEGGGDAAARENAERELERGDVPAPPPVTRGGTLPDATSKTPDPPTPPPAPPAATRDDPSPRPAAPKADSPPPANPSPKPESRADTDKTPATKGVQQPSSAPQSQSGGGGFASLPLQWLGAILSALANLFGGEEERGSDSVQPNSEPKKTPAIAAASITANPNPLERDERARLAWASVGTSECAIVDPLLNVLARDINGALDTVRLQESTRFGMICDIENGTDKYVNEVLIRVKGDESDPPPIFAQTGRVSRAPAVQGGQGASESSSGSGTNVGDTVKPLDVRVCDPEQPINTFIRCLCEVEPNPNGCALVPR